jgi:hypothetical protein
MVHKTTGRVTPIVEENGKFMFNIWVRSSGGKKGETAANQGKRSENRFCRVGLRRREDRENPNSGFSWRGEIF